MRDLSDAERYDLGERRYVAAVAGMSAAAGVGGGGVSRPPPYTTELIGAGSRSARVSLRTALQLVALFPHRPPGVEELQNRFGMSRATAYRWRAAFIEARGNRRG